MQISPNPRILYDENAHLYLNTDTGKLLMGVTSLMKKHNLGADYGDIPDKILENAAKEGSRLHKAIEDYDNGETFFLTPFLEGYRDICLHNGLKFVCNELLVSDEETVASMIDGVYEGTSPNSVILVDYKFTQKIHWRALSWQLSIYRTLFERQYNGLHVEGIKVLHGDKKKEKVLGLYDVEPIPEEEIDALFDCERNGTIYVDVDVKPSADLVLTSTELADYVNNIEAVQAFKEKLAEVEAKLKEYDEKLLGYMLDNNIVEMECPSGTFKVKAGYERTTIDSTRFKEQFPQLYQNFSKATKVKPSLMFNKKK